MITLLLIRLNSRVIWSQAVKMEINDCSFLILGNKVGSRVQKNQLKKW
jgi:hypothetical protein